MISVWLLFGFMPYAASEFVKIYQEFEIKLPRVTELVVSLSDTVLRYGLWRYPFVVVLSVCALIMPEIFFHGKKPE
jgi:type II secretory pathway component PulF